MEEMLNSDFIDLCLKLQIIQFAKYGSPVELTFKEMYNAYGKLLLDGLSLEEKQKMLIQMMEVM